MRYRIIDNFLTEQECQQIIEMAKPRLERSTGWDVEKGMATVTDYRNSSQMYFRNAENELIARIEQRIADETGTRVEQGEGIQCLRYNQQEHYKVHWDWFDPAYPQNKQVLDRGGQRIITFMCYLNNVKQGGETHFPRVPSEDRSDSLKIKPVQGRGVMWWNVDENGNIDRDTLHEGCDPANGQEKFVITRWIRERAFF